MRSALLLALCLAAGCNNPRFGGPGTAPFTCPDGVCPRGFRCAEGLCIAPGEPDPPRRLAVTALDSAPPQPVWDGQRFAVFWQQNDPLADAPGLNVTVLGETPLTRNLSGLTGDVAFASMYHAASQRYVVALRRNDELRAQELVVSSLGAGETVPRLEWRCSRLPSSFGFSAPALAPGRDGTVLLAYTLGTLPDVSDDLYWTRLVPGTGETLPCAARTVGTGGRYANEVVVVENAAGVQLLWRDLTVYLTPVSEAGQGITQALPFFHVASAVVAGSQIALAAQRAQRIGVRTPPWIIGLGDVSRSLNLTQQPLVSPNLVPDVVSDGRRFIACGRGEDGELRLSLFDLETLAPIPGPEGELRVPRISQAEIASCRLASAPPSVGRVAVAWAERVPPSTLYQYVTLVDVPR